MSDERDEQLHELSGLYALDALDPAERTRFEEHLEACPSCREEVASFQETAAQLVEDDVPPPPAMRENILDQLDSIPQDAPAPRSDAGSQPTDRPRREADQDAPSRSEGPEDSSSDQDTFTPVRGRRRRGRIIAGIAGLAVAASITVFAVVERPWQPDEAPLTPEQQVVEASDAERFDGETADGAVAVVYSPSRGQAVLEVSDLEPPPEGHAYQAWYLQEDGDPVSAGMLPSEQEDAEATLLEGDPGDAVGVALTVEPEGGSEQPTSEPPYIVEFS